MFSFRFSGFPLKHVRAKKEKRSRAELILPIMSSRAWNETHRQDGIMATCPVERRRDLTNARHVIETVIILGIQDAEDHYVISQLMSIMIAK